jgi:decaprenylphospho-beta-D-erythro-pentofuranosid-2-ulose 2-reductase
MSTVLILGATSDIGTAIARKFARMGYDIQLAGRELPAVRRASADLSIRYPVRCSAYLFDADSKDQHASFFQQLHTVPDITIYVIGYMNEGTTTFKDPGETEKTISSNFTGAVSILNIVAENYAARKQGTLIGISSVAGDRGRQSNFIYGSAKAGFNAYLSGLRNYLYPLGIHVITVKPGFVYTKMTDHLSLPATITATPEQVADAVYKSFINRSNIIYVKPVWKWIMWVIRSIPESIFKKVKL